MLIWKTCAALCLAAGILTGCAPAVRPGLPQETVYLSPGSSSPHPFLKKKIDDILRRELFPYSNAGIKVLSLRTGETVYEYNPRQLHSPASNQKLFTAAAALSLLGKDKQVSTTVHLDPEEDAIYLKGCGDSMLTVDDLEDLATAVSGKLDHNKVYALKGDLTCFDDMYWGKGWMWDDDSEPDGMYLSPLSVNHNTVTVRVSPGKAAGLPAVVSVFPAAKLVKVENAAVTGAAGERRSVKVTRNSGDRENLITVSGTIPLRTSHMTKAVAVWKPEMIALGVFGDLLSERGIAVTGTAIAAASPNCVIVARKERPVTDLVRFTLKRSDNLSAESLLKVIALQATGRPGSADCGTREILNYMSRLDIPVEKLVFVDGSGLSRYNLTNAETIVRLLEQVYRDQSIYPLFHDSLPIAGKDGTLAGRMKRTPAERNLRAKTGTMTGISALSGYLTTAEGEPLAFSIIIQNYPGPAKNVRDIQDRIGVLLCSFRRE